MPIESLFHWNDLEQNGVGLYLIYQGEIEGHLSKFITIPYWINCTSSAFKKYFL